MLIAALENGREIDAIILGPTGQTLGRGLLNREGGSIPTLRAGVAWSVRVTLDGGQWELPLHEPVRSRVGEVWRVEFERGND